MRAFDPENAGLNRGRSIWKENPAFCFSGCREPTESGGSRIPFGFFFMQVHTGSTSTNLIAFPLNISSMIR